MEIRKHQVEALEAIQKYNEGIIHLPTGVGKTIVEALTISTNIKNGFEDQKDIPVFVVLAPRILLSNQLYMVVKDILLSQHIDCHYLIVHSGRTEDKIRRMWMADLPYRQLKSTTSSREIREEYEKAKSENVPLIIFGTYDSSERIMTAKVPVYTLLCDEGQYLVSERFGWIPLEKEDNKLIFFDAKRKYYFTATLKETSSDQGLGMNNKDLFGLIIYEKTPAQMIVAGEMIRPRMHFVDVINESEASELDEDVNAIISAFIEHKAQCKISPKMLVVTKGSKHLDDITRHPKMKNFQETRPNLQIFDISSAYKPRINGVEVKRELFLSTLRELTDKDEAIIFHIDILSEGIDVPGITGIMPMNVMGLGKFLQNLGRATRLHERDREKLYKELIKYNELEKFIKDYAWIIIPIYGVIGEDLKELISETVYALRDYGFVAAEDVYIKENKGKALATAIGGINVKDVKVKALFDTLVDVEHTIEEKVKADEITLEEFRLKERVSLMSEEELVKF